MEGALNLPSDRLLDDDDDVIPTLSTNFVTVKLDEGGWKASFYATRFTVLGLH